MINQEKKTCAFIQELKTCIIIMNQQDYIQKLEGVLDEGV